jgi:hypothetical protein
MILYRLRCNADHEFEAWFKNSSTYDKQLESGLLSCPDCGSPHVSKALMAPALKGTKGKAEAADKQVMATAADLKQQLLTLRRKIEQNCDNVGDRFAEEARKIHYGDAEARGIYGDTSSKERDALKDEGIEIATVPWLRDDA